jgi:hypothetical protein
MNEFLETVPWIILAMTPGLMILQYLIWFSHVKDKTFDHRWEFWVGMIPYGMYIVWLTWTMPYIREWFIGLKDGIRYYIK